MANSLKRAHRFARLLTALGASCSALFLGCGQQSASSQEKTPTPIAGVVLTTTTPPTPVATVKQPRDRLHQSFQDATTDEPPEGQKLLEQTKNQLSVGKLYETVVQSWDEIKFVSPAGKRLAYSATIKTDLGNAVIELWPDVAPNHVRNFVALARAGYYNGLEFDLTYNDLTENPFLPGLIGGCPEGSGEVGLGSIGYWMIPELSDKVKHEAGTVGAWHDPGEVETGACKFYISMDKAPVMDGNDYSVFGKVIQGLDVVRTIWSRPVVKNGSNRPEQPVVIREVTIGCREVEAVQPR